MTGKRLITKKSFLATRFVATSAAFLFLSQSLSADPAEDYKKKIVPLLEKHCYSCHGPKRQSGDLNLSTFEELQQVVEAPERWQSVLEAVQAYEMPPKPKELGFDEFQRLVDWLRNLPKPEKPDCNQIASDRNASYYRGYVMSRRLNRAEYNNTVRDLVGVDLHLQNLLPTDGGGGEGFDTSGNALFTSSIHIEKYLAAATKVVDAILPDKTGKLTPELKKAYEGILVAKPGFLAGEREIREAGEKVITTFARRAYRRTLTKEDVDPLMALFDRAYSRGDGFVPSVRLAVKATLVSPNFLFMAEPEPDGGGVRKLGPFPLATRLSYFIWSSMPDDELLAVAESGQLMDEAVYLQQIRRMMADPKADALGERFALQWLDLDKLGPEVKPDPNKFPEWDAELNHLMHQEVISYFNYIFRSNHSLTELIDSDYTFVNQRLAELYGLTGVSGRDLQKVSLTDRNRGGLIGMAAVHASTSFPLRTSPVLRGRWVLESLLGERVPPPPPGVPPLEEGEKAEHVSLRAQLEVHRKNPDCAACHNKMDPLGFGLENFDVLGRWRDSDRGQPVDSEGVLPSGEKFAGITGLKTILLGRKDPIVKNLVRKMTGYALGRELTRFDQCVVDKAMELLQTHDYRAQLLVEHIALSFPFQHRFYPKSD